MSYVIGLDYGTNSCRALLMEVGKNDELASTVYNYAIGDLGVITDPSNPHVARQHPKDYVDGLFHTITETIKKAEASVPGFNAADIIGIAGATTGSTVIPVDSNNQPLALSDKYFENPDAMAWLWKDHTSTAEAAQITELAKAKFPKLIESIGIYSSEWFWAKILHLKNSAPAVFEEAYSYIELCDYLPAVLAGIENPADVKRSICAAGHKALYLEDGGMPPDEFLAELDPALVDVKKNLFSVAYPSNQQAGKLSNEWAEKLGLTPGIALAVGAFDCHMGAVGAGVKENTMIKIMGTSTCDIMVSKEDKIVPGICGSVPHSVLPGSTGLEAGQSAVGDLFLWLTGYITPDSYGATQDEKFATLNAEADKLKPGQTGLIALDWNNGNRSLLTDTLLGGLFIGQTLHTKAHELYRALIEATAFGALKIIARIEECGVPVNEVICCGGLAQKNAMMMQIYADVTNRPIKITDSDQTCAAGAAIFAAAAALGTEVEELAKDMAADTNKTYTPIPENAAVYKRLFSLYEELHDSFGVKGTDINLFHVMKDLHTIRAEAFNA